MGAWDVSIFGNDGAGDFLFEFDDAHTVGEVTPILEEALDAVLGSGGVDSIDGEIGLAAAALVVAWRNPKMLDDEAGEDFSPWPRTTDPLPERLAAKADRVLQRMQQPEGNELFELWAEEDQSEEFVAEIARWRSARS